MTSNQENHPPTRFLSLAILGTIVLGWSVCSLPVAAVTIDAIDAGFVTEAGGSAKGDGTLVAGATFNYSVGREVHFADGALATPPPFPPMDRNNYFVFDLGGITEPIIGASLELFTGMYESVDPSETFDVVAPSDPGAAFADSIALGIGNSIGPSEFDFASDPLVSIAAALYGNIEGSPLPPLATAIIDASMDFTTISIPFTDLAYLNGFIGGPVILGGTVPTATAPDTPQQPFGFTGPDLTTPGDPTAPMLVLTLASTATPAPEPGTLVLAGLSLAGVGWVRRREARRQRELS